jgi:corrinoid protein of di/trimethylamine methyltransferase
MAEKIFEELIQAVIVGDGDAAGRLARQGLADKIDPMTITEKGLIPAMAIVSEKYDKKEYYLPQMLLSSEAFYEAFNILKQHMKVETKGKGKVLIGVVEGDVHDIGKNLVRIVLEANGFVCIDMGRDVPIEDYLQKVAEEKPDFLMLSTLMTPTMLSMKRTLEGLVEEGLRDKVKVAVGGGPISWEFCKKIGADFYGDNEKEALKWAKSVVEK